MVVVGGGVEIVDIVGNLVVVVVVVEGSLVAVGVRVVVVVEFRFAGSL